MKVTILGCGASMGTPNAGGYWGACDPENPRNFRTRASLFVATEKTRIVVDTSYDLRMQLTREGIKDLDAVLISHDHTDHVNGIDDLRPAALHNNKMIDFYSNKETIDALEGRWPYLFNVVNKIYTPYLKKYIIGGYDKFRIGDIDVETFEQDHRTCTSLGFRFGPLAYSVDIADMNEKSLNVLKGIETWIVDAAAYHKETIQTHANLKRVMQWVDIIKPKMTYLTVLSSYMDYQKLCDELPPHIRPAYDGLKIDLSGNAR